MKFIFPLATVAMLAVPALAAPASAPDGNQSLSEQYRSCTQMAALKPKETLERAQKWFAETGQIAAQHCIALSQFELRDYEGAAATLDDLLLKVDQKQGNLWFSMKKQAIRAHMNSGGGPNGEKHLTDALRYASDRNLDKEMVPLLVDRAKLFAARDEHLRAIQDLDHALSLSHTPPVMLERARVYLKMGDTKAAEADIQSVLKADPLNEAASQMLGDLERRMNELKSEAEKKAAASAAPPVVNNYYGASGEGSNGAEPARKLTFDERVAKARAERARKYGWDK